MDGNRHPSRGRMIGKNGKPDQCREAKDETDETTAARDPGAAKTEQKEAEHAAAEDAGHLPPGIERALNVDESHGDSGAHDGPQDGGKVQRADHLRVAGIRT